MTDVDRLSAKRAPKLLALGLRSLLMCSAAAGLAAAMSATPALAQKLSSEIHGQITGADGAPVSGATIKVTNTSTGATLTTTTNADGLFELTGLPVGGPYTIVVEASGYSSKTLTGVRLQPEKSDLEVNLARLEEVETVVVTAERSKAAAATAIVEQHGVASNFSAEDIAQTPSFQNNLKDIMQRSPFAYVDPVGGGNLPPIATLNVAGTNPRCVPLLVDGLEQSDNFGLNFSGYPTPTSPVAFPWIDTAQLVVTPYDVEYNSCGPVQNIVTKQGSNDFHGGFYGSFDDQSLNGRKYGTPSVFGMRLTNTHPNKPPYKNENFGAYLSGPIIPDHLFFFVGYDQNNNITDPGAQTAVGPAGSGFAKIAANISQAQVDQVANITKSVYGFDPGNINEGFDEFDQKYIGKLTWQINDSQRIVASYQHTEGETLTVNSGSTSTTTPEITLPSDWYLNRQKLESMTLQYFANWTDNFSTQVNVGHTSVRDDQVPQKGTNFPAVYVRTPGANGVYDLGTSTASNNASDDGYVVVGPDFSRQFNFLNYKDNFAKVLGTLVLSDHTLKAGAEFHRYGYNDDFLQGAQSVVRFDSITDYQNQKIAQTIDTRFNATASSVQNGNPIYFANGAINGVVATPAAADGIFNFNIWTFFVQDEWNPIPHLDITAGVRLDQYSMGDRPTLNPTFTSRYGFTNQQTFNGKKTFDPRLSANYDWIPDQDYLPDSDVNFRGGIGKLAGGILPVWLTNSFDTNGINAISAFGIPSLPPGPCSTTPPNNSFSCVPDTLPTDHQAWLNDLDNGPLSLASVQKNSTVNALLPGFHLPQTLFYNLGTDVHFGSGWLGDNWTLTVDMLRSNDYNQPYWTNLRIEPIPGTTAPDGRLLYQWTFDPTHGRPDPAGVNTSSPVTGTDIGLGSVDDGHRNIWAFSLSNAWKDTGYGDFSLYMSYTHEHVTDAGSDVSSVANSTYQNRASVNYNQPEVGTSDYNRKHRFTLDLDVTEHFIGELASIFDIYAQRLSGQPFSLVFNGNPFGPSSGGVTGKSLVYVPKVDPTTHLVTATSDPAVTYAGGFDLVGFNTMLQQTGLIKYSGKIAPRNAFDGPWNTLINLKVDQELPTFIDNGDHLFVEAYIYNFGNLLNHNWGPQYSPNFYQAYTAINPTIVGNKYQYNSFTTTSGIVSNISANRAPSTYQVAFAVKYDF
jgi:outer membrane receptor for ferrienterochelin and colicin